jgi:hypothetical protein
LQRRFDRILIARNVSSLVRPNQRTGSTIYRLNIKTIFAAAETRRMVNDTLARGFQ